MLTGGRFLLRDRESLELGDGSLELKPFLRFPGPLLGLEMDPEQKFLVTSSREAMTARQSGVAASAPPNESGQKADNGSSIAMRILRRDSGEVMLVSRSPAAIHLPINSEGYWRFCARRAPMVAEAELLERRKPDSWTSGIRLYA